MLSSDNISIPVKKCDRYCPKHPMIRCGGILNHRGFHQCSECEIEGNGDIRFPLNPNTPRYFEYR